MSINLANYVALYQTEGIYQSTEGKLTVPKFIKTILLFQ